MYDILVKYEQYNIDFNHTTRTIYIYRDIPVKELMNLRKDLEGLGLKYNDIIINGR